MVRKDYQEGVYRNGKFMPYQMYGEYKARLDPASPSDALNAGRHGKILHGSFKDGLFRPANIKGEAGFMAHINLPSGESYRLNYQGAFFDERGKQVGRVEESGRLSFYMQGNRNAGRKSRGGDVKENRER